jgi:hypothetical protein
MCGLQQKRIPEQETADINMHITWQHTIHGGRRGWGSRTGYVPAMYDGSFYTWVFLECVVYVRVGHEREAGAYAEQGCCCTDTQHLVEQ